MDVRHFLKIYNDNENGGVVRIIRSRSFNDINFKRFYQGENKIGLVSVLQEKIEFSPNEILYLISDSAYEHTYEFNDAEEKQARKARIISEDQELQWAYSEMGDLANICGKYEVQAKNLDNQIAKFERAILRNSEDKVIYEVIFKNGGFTLKEINDFCNAVQYVHAQKPYLNFNQIKDELLPSKEDETFAENYEKLVKILGRVGKFKNIKSRNTQLSFDLFGNISAETKKGKQRGN